MSNVDPVVGRDIQKRIESCEKCLMDVNDKWIRLSSLSEKAEGKAKEIYQDDMNEAAVAGIGLARKLSKLYAARGDDKTIVIANIEGIGAMELALYSGLKVDAGYMWRDGLIRKDSLYRFQTLLQAKRIYVFDMVLPEIAVKALIEFGKELHIYDWHDGNEWINNYEGCVWDHERCASKIYYDTYMDKKTGALDKFVHMVDQLVRRLTTEPDFENSKKLNYVYQYLIDDYQMDESIENIQVAKDGKMLFPYIDCYARTVAKFPNDDFVFTEEEEEMIRKYQEPRTVIITNEEGILAPVLAVKYAAPFTPPIYSYVWKDGYRNNAVVKHAKCIFMFNVTVDEEIVKELIAEGKKLYISDYHQGNEWLNNYEGCHWSNTKGTLEVFLDNYGYVMKPKGALVEMAEIATAVTVGTPTPEQLEIAEKGNYLYLYLTNDFHAINDYIKLADSGSIIVASYERYAEWLYAKINEDHFAFSAEDEKMIEEYRRHHPKAK